MNRYFLDVVALLDIGCWCVCFWWMHRISARQAATLDQLQQQAHRIEKVSKKEHEILTELHPNVQKIQEGLAEVVDKVAPVQEQ
jgi:iron-sulfur cluster repair protein YtfE (RIC family)